MTPMQQIVERLEGRRELDRVGRPLAAAAKRATRAKPVKNALSGTWLGHQLHPMLTDIPIGSFVAAGMMDLTGGAARAGAARRLVGFGVLTALPTAAAGSSDWSDTYGAELRVGVVHALANLSAVVLNAASYLARRHGRRGVGIALSTAGLGVMAGAGYLGGHLSYTRGVGVNHTAFQQVVEEWTDIAAPPELPANKLVRVMAGGVPVVLVREGEQISALSATCVHAGGPLDEGELLDGCVRCPWHGSTYRLVDGGVVRGPAATPQPCWKVRVHEGQLQVRQVTR